MTQEDAGPALGELPVRGGMTSPTLGELQVFGRQGDTLLSFPKRHIWPPGSQSMVHGPAATASPRTLLEMQNRVHPSLPDQHLAL